MHAHVASNPGWSDPLTEPLMPPEMLCTRLSACSRSSPTTGRATTTARLDRFGAAIKSHAGRRTIGIPESLARLLESHQREQQIERAAAGQLWSEGGWLFTTPTGEPINPRSDNDDWTKLLNAPVCAADDYTTPVTPPPPSYCCSAPQSEP